MSSKKFKLVESETAASTVLANSIQNMILEKQLKVLNKTENTVMNRICMNQKFVLKRHQQKVKYLFIPTNFYYCERNL